MAQSRLQHNISLVAACGFACLQAYMYSFLYLGAQDTFADLGFSFYQARSFLVLAWMVLAFFIVRRFSTKARRALMAPTSLWCFSLLMAISGVLGYFPNHSLWSLVLETFLSGIPTGCFLAAWGRCLSESIVHSLPATVLVACLLAGIISLPLDFFTPAALVITALLPLVSCFIFVRLLPKDSSELPETTTENTSLKPLAFSDVITSKSEHEEALKLSTKMLAGTLVFGIASGFMQVFHTDVSHATANFVSFILLVAFAVASMQLIGVRMFEKQDATTLSATEQKEKLNDVYRLSLLLMMAGYLFVPVLGSFGVPGEAIVLSGYLGLTYVLTALFLLMARVDGSDPSIAFARGFSFLFFGVLVGIALGNSLVALQPTNEIPYFVAAFAGLSALFAYLFLFTEDDFKTLSDISEQVDVNALVCETIAKRYKLSKRESEILPLALRGRTGERIASELFISKSTAETHLRRISTKTNTHGRQELIDLSEKIRTELKRSEPSNHTPKGY